MKKKDLIDASGKILQPDAPASELYKVAHVPSNDAPPIHEKQYVIAAKQTIKRMKLIRPANNVISTRSGPSYYSKIIVTFICVLGYPLLVIAKFGGYVFRTSSKAAASKFQADMDKENPNPFRK